MIDRRKAAFCYVWLKRTANIGGGCILLAITIPIISALLFSGSHALFGFSETGMRISAAIAIVIAFVGGLSLLATCYWIAATAAALDKIFSTWLVGTIILGPVSFFIAYYRIVSLARNNAIK